MTSTIDKIIRNPQSYIDKTVTISGRYYYRRGPFIDIEGETGYIQVYFEKNGLKNACDISSGNFVAINGKVGYTNKGKLCIFANSSEVLSKNRRSFKMEKLSHSLKKFSSAVYNREKRRIITVSNQIVSSLREVLNNEDFTEVLTPTLITEDMGVKAKSFKVANVYELRRDHDLDTRAHLLFMPKVFQIGQVFRDEGISSRYKPEFIMSNIFALEQDYTTMTKILIRTLQLCKERDNQFNLPETVFIRNFEECVEDKPGKEVKMEYREVVNEIKESQLKLLGVYNNLDWKLFRKNKKSYIQNPTFIVGIPPKVNPLSKVDIRSGYSESAQFVWQARTVAHFCNEENDESQLRTGNSKGEGLYREILEYGLPTFCGMGINLESLIQAELKLKNVWDIFPSLLR